MHRSASTSRAYDEYLKYYSSPNQELPILGPMSEESKKGRSRTRFSDNAVHVIPFVLLFCALILWFLSNPDMDLPMKVDEASGLRLVGELDSDTDQTGALAGIDLGLGDIDSTAKQDDNNNSNNNNSDKERSTFTMNKS